MFNFNSKKNSKDTDKLINEIRTLQLNLNSTTNDYLNQKEVSKKYQDEYNNLVKNVKDFCKVILDSKYAQKQITGEMFFKNFSVQDFLENAKKEYSETLIENRNLILSITQKLKEKDEEIEGLKIQLSRYIVNHGEDGPNPQFEIPKEAPKNERINLSNEEKMKIDEEKKSPFVQKECLVKVVSTDIDDDEEILPTKTINKNNNKIDKRNENKNLLNTQKNNIIASKTETEIEDDDEVILNTTQKEVFNPKAKKDNSIIHVVDLKDYMNELSDVMWSILEAIGKHGYSEGKIIKDYVIDIYKKNPNSNISDGYISNCFAELKKMKFIEQNKIHTGNKGLFVYYLTQTGERVFEEKFNQMAVMSEYHKLKKEHATPLHGYVIKHTAIILKNSFNYDTVEYDSKINEIKLYNGDIYVPDIVAKKEKGKVIDYFEVELGHHTQNDFNKKCEKMLKVTKNLYFITTNVDIINKKLTKQVAQWVLDSGGKHKLRGIKIYITTTSKLNEGKWEHIFDF